MIKVVAALIKNKDNILIAKRLDCNDNVLGKWEFPGGKVEDNESEKEAVEREILEEFELKVKAERFIANNIHIYPNKTIDLRLYECTYIGGEFKLHDHSEYAWVKKEDLLNYELCPADIPLAKCIMEEEI